MISHEHRTIFVHIPKCGGQSVETAFLNDLSLSWNQRRTLLLRPNTKPQKGPPRLAHLTAREYVELEYTSSETFRAHYKFAIIRHPLNRAVSMYNFRHFRSELKWFIHDYLPDLFEKAGDRDHYVHDHNQRYFHLRPQVEFLYDLDGKLMVDDLVRLEEIGTEFDTVRQKAGLASDLPYVNDTPKKPASVKDLDSKDIDQLAQLYARDFELLGYEVM